MSVLRLANGQSARFFLTYVGLPPVHLRRAKSGAIIPTAPIDIGGSRGHSGYAQAMSDHPIPFGAVDPTNRDHETTHIPGSIQPHGALLTFDPRDLRVVHAGGDTVGLLGTPAIALLGAAAADILEPAQCGRLQTLLEARRPLLRSTFAFTMIRGDRAPTDVIAHMSDGLLVVEFEPRRMPIIEDALALVQGMVHRVRRPGSLQGFLEAIATEVRAVTGFDRVMICRFASDGGGAAVAEARGEGVDSFFGVNFPADVVPQQARDLYLRNWIRTSRMPVLHLCRSSRRSIL